MFRVRIHYRHLLSILHSLIQLVSIIQLKIEQTKLNCVISQKFRLDDFGSWHELTYSLEHFLTLISFQNIVISDNIIFFS